MVPNKNNYMKKYPKYIILPSIMLIYFIVMTIFMTKENGWKLPEDFWKICSMEVVIIVALFFSLRYLHKRRNS